MSKYTFNPQPIGWNASAETVCFKLNKLFEMISIRVIAHQLMPLKVLRGYQAAEMNHVSQLLGHSVVKHSKLSSRELTPLEPAIFSEYRQLIEFGSRHPSDFAANKAIPVHTNSLSVFTKNQLVVDTVLAYGGIIELLKDVTGPMKYRESEFCQIIQLFGVSFEQYRNITHELGRHRDDEDYYVRVAGVIGQ